MFKRKEVTMKLAIAFFMIFGWNVAQAKKATMASTKVSIDTASSKINWAGEKIIPGKGHKGTIKIQAGHITMNRGALAGGEFTINMDSIDSTDLSGSMEGKLVGHLKSPDFFDVKNHPTATFKVTKVSKQGKDLFKVTGDLTLRGTTDSETFTVKITKTGKNMIATGKLSLNRKKYKVQYNSEADFLSKAISIPKDKVIKDTVSLDLSLKTVSM